MSDRDECEDYRLSQTSNWAKLTHDCLINILSQLTLEQRWTGPMFVCMSWFTACKDASLNSVFDLESHFQSLNESLEWWTNKFQRKMDSMLISVTNWSNGSLKEIRTRHCSDRSLNFVAERCPNLQVLSIKKCPKVTDDSMCRIAYQCPGLEELDISYSYGISHKSLVMIGKNCPNLKILKRNVHDTGMVPHWYLSEFPRDKNAEVAAIANHMPNLEHLELQNFGWSSAYGVPSICEGCLNLQYLDVSGLIVGYVDDPHFTESTSKLKNLRNFKRPTFNNSRRGSAFMYLPLGY